MESEGIPDSTVNIGEVKERIRHNLLQDDDNDDERTSTVTTKGNNLLISRVFKKATPTTTPSTSTLSMVQRGLSSESSSQQQQQLQITKSESTIPKLSFIGKGLDNLNSNSNHHAISTSNISTTSPTKTTYGLSNSSRPAGPVRNFLRPTSTSKFPSVQSKIFSTSHNTSSNTLIPSSSSSSTSISNTTTNTQPNINVTKKLPSASNPELVGSSSSSSSKVSLTGGTTSFHSLNLNSSQMSSAFVTNSNQTSSLKLQIRRNLEPTTTAAAATTKETLVSFPSATISKLKNKNNNFTAHPSVATGVLPNDDDSNVLNTTGPAPRYSVKTPEDSSGNFGGNNASNNFVSSSSSNIEESAVSTIRPSPVSIIKIKEKHHQPEKSQQSSHNVIRQLNPEFVRQVQQHSNEKIVDINIDDNAASSASQIPPTLNVNVLTNNKKSSGNMVSSKKKESGVSNIICDDNEEEEMEEDEVDDESYDDEVSNSESLLVNSDTSRDNNNTITITIGDEGVISERPGDSRPMSPLKKKKAVDSNGNNESNDDTRRTKRKRKPTRPFMQDMVVPRLKIRRKKGDEAEAEGTSSPSNVRLSFETVDDKNSVNKNSNTTAPKIMITSTATTITSPTMATNFSGLTSPGNSTNDKVTSESEKSPEKTPRPRGRPKGSVNKAKTEIPAKPTPVTPAAPVTPATPGTPRGRGRPRGSTNKNKVDREATKLIKEVKQRKRRKTSVLSSTSDKDTSKETIDVDLSPTKEASKCTALPEKLEVREGPEEKGEVNQDSSIADSTTSASPTSSQVPTDRNSEVMSSPSKPVRRRGAPRGPRIRGAGRGGVRGRGERGERKERGERGERKLAAVIPKPGEPGEEVSERKILKPRKPRIKKEKPVKPKKESKPQIVATPVQVFEEETRMSADIRPSDIKDIKITLTPISEPPSTPTPSLIQSIAPILLQDEESVGASNMSSTSTSAQGTTKTKKFTKDLVPDRKPVTADTLFEYCWPPTDEHGEMYMLQEQVSEYLGVKSFKRKYPDMNRRIVDIEERDFLRASKAVSETQCDLGLTALSSSDVLDIMFNDFPDKYEEFSKMLQERKEKELVKNKISNSSAPPVRDRSAEYYRRCLKSAAKWNATMNRQRKDERSCSFDLQTLTLHYQKGKMKVLPPEATKVGHYPVAVLPGQYCDSFKRFTPDELKYLPLNTVVYGPILPRERIADIESDSDDECSSSSSSSSSSTSSDDSDSDDSSTSSKEGNMSTEVAIGPRFSGILQNGITVDSGEKRFCKTCEGDYTKNKLGQPEALLHCTKCDVPHHPSCLELRTDMLPFIKKYNWQCTDCKNCIECNDPADEDKMLFCDLCDRGYHIYCVGLRKVPIGRWHCQVCSVCFSCGVTQPAPNDRLAEWHHEFKKGEKNTRHFMHSYCVSCHKLYKKGQFCPTCLKVHLKLDDKSLSECRSCEKWVHKECGKRPLGQIFGLMCEPCCGAFSASHFVASKK